MKGVNVHPMCNDCIAKPVCFAKFGQPTCIEVQRLRMEYGKHIADFLKEKNNENPKTNDRKFQRDQKS